MADLAGILVFYHQALGEAISRSTGRAVKVLPLGNGRGEPEWLEALSAQHKEEANALGLVAPPDFSDYDLKDPAEFASFTWILSQDLDRLLKGAGLA